MANQKLSVILNLDGTKYVMDLKRMKDGTQQSATAMSKAFNAINFRNLLYGSFGVYAIKRGVEEIGGAFISAASKAENYQVRMKATLRSQSEANRMFSEMASYAAKVPHRYEDVMNAATNLSGVMSGGVNEIKQYMPIIGDLAAVTGMSVDEVTGQVIRMYSAGAASADMFRERGVLAMLGFQAGVSYSAEETRKKLIEAWESPTSKIRGATDELAKNWDGKVSMMSDKWFQFRVNMMDTGMFDVVKKSIDGINSGMDGMVAASKKMATNHTLEKYLQSQGTQKGYYYTEPSYTQNKREIKGVYSSKFKYGYSPDQMRRASYQMGFDRDKQAAYEMGMKHEELVAKGRADYMARLAEEKKKENEAAKKLIEESKYNISFSSGYVGGGMYSFKGASYGANPSLRAFQGGGLNTNPAQMLGFQSGTQGGAVQDMRSGWDNVASDIRYSFANTFRTITNEAITFKNVMVSVARDISDAFANEASKRISDYVVGAFVDSMANNGAAKVG